MRLCAILIKPVLLGMLAMLLGAGLLSAADIDDAAVFLEAFNAFHKKDYMLAIEKASQLNQVFPDSPLRDVTLLLIARSSIKSGENELAAKSIIKFKDDFSDSSLISTIEEELSALGSRLQKGEPLQPDKQLQAAARKTRDDRLALERAVALKQEQEKLAREKAELERIAQEKKESERRERERLAAEKTEKESIKAVILIRDRINIVAAGQNGSIPVEISNQGKNRAEFLIEASAAPEFGAFLASSDNSDKSVTRIELAVGETFKGKAHFKMPADKVDGHRAALTIKTVSSKYNDVIEANKALLITSAPLVRVVAKLARPKVTPGELLQYRITVLNIGSLSAKDLTVRLKLPPELDLVSSTNLKFRRELDGTLFFNVDQIEPGNLADINLDVKVKESSRIGQELRGQVEVVNNQLRHKDIFAANASVVQAKQ